MFKLVRKNNKGVSLVELLVCLVIVGLLLPLGYQTLHSLTYINNSTVDKWDVQTAARMASRDFESNKEGLANAFQVDLVYDPVIEGGIVLDASGNITWKDGSASSHVMNMEGIAPSSEEHTTDVYTYIFSAETWDHTGAYLGELLYMRSYGDTRSHRLLQDYGLDDIPVAVSFSVGTTKSLKTESGKYTTNSVVVHFYSGLDTIEYGFDATFTMKNLSRPINYSGGNLVSELAWTYDATQPLVYTAGWDDYDLNYDASGALTTSKGFPSAETAQDGSKYYLAKFTHENTVYDIHIAETFDMEVYNDDGIYEKTVSGAPVIARQGNVLRYKSPAAERTHGEVKENATAANVASCLTGFAMVGSDMEETVLKNIRGFRDNVLAGTEFGDWFIHEYYYTWSPFLIEHTAFLKPVYQAILIPISYVCDLVTPK